jgi:hypothetical protein
MTPRASTSVDDGRSTDDRDDTSDRRPGLISLVPRRRLCTPSRPARRRLTRRLTTLYPESQHRERGSQALGASARSRGVITTKTLHILQFYLPTASVNSNGVSGVERARRSVAVSARAFTSDR